MRRVLERDRSGRHHVQRSQLPQTLLPVRLVWYRSESHEKDTVRSERQWQVLRAVSCEKVCAQMRQVRSVHTTVFAVHAIRRQTLSQGVFCLFTLQEESRQQEVF